MRESILVLAASCLFLGSAQAASGITAELAGNACEEVVGSHEVQEISTGRFMIPSSLYLKKDEDKRLARGTCTFAVSLRASAGKKIVVSNVSQLASLRAYPSGVTARVDLEIFKAGAQGNRQSLEVRSEDKVERLTKTIGERGVVVETECEGSAILRGNLSAMLMGAGKARAFTRNLLLDIEEVDCQ